MRNPAEVKQALSVRLSRTEMESRNAAREHAVSDKRLDVLQKATRHLEKKPLKTLDIPIGSVKWDDHVSENIAFIVAKDLSSDFAALTGDKPSDRATTFIYESTIPGLYIRRKAYYPLTGKYRTTYALVGNATP